MADTGKDDVKGSNSVTERAKEETLGRRDDIGADARSDGVKDPNMFERAKEEIQALVDVIYTHGREREKEKDHHQSPPHHPDSLKRDQSDKGEPKLEKKEDHEVKAPNLLERAKEELEAIIHRDSSPRGHPHRHDKETHGRSDDIDYDTPIDEVKAPSVFERAKEEIEAVVEAIHPKKEAKKDSVSPHKEGGGFDLGATVGRGLERVCSPGKEDGLRSSIGKGLEKVCSPFGHKKDQ